MEDGKIFFVEWNGEDYKLHEDDLTKMFLSIVTFVNQQYEELPDSTKIPAMAVTRGILVKLEREEKDKEKKLRIRPPKRKDPTLHLMDLMLKYIEEALFFARLTIDVNEDRYIKSISIQHAREGGGSLLADGNERER